MIKPLFDRILVLEDDADTVTETGLHIPDNAVGRVTTGVVKEIGNGLINSAGRHRPLAVKPGDRVMFRLPSGTQVRVAETKYLMLRESDIHGILED